ncbi:hypothetical protein GCM10007275_03170 [Jeotgalicoccus coquinae]|mgnify:CR=1 FL=1|uniref:ABC-type Co2+ transport system permease subunit n=1 Tax=Jeotgalicoccus coquinae TaxID=709509 RepID=A0A6V7R8A1_9STAP|nr:hypothetical protein [Jeotgalicoccus coquinae]MBB6423018.1 ABC-type Co2+ transport system permease subunit [Jeotgalicoccus coquinae]GGE11342.1 hypothetical protein GCM10007275_03170 [Jeotgalicoccus coquinae]CAD2073516.1 hypothetical protein JEOCOQ751_00665 [Jeotgalicoccus coquinae]
MIAREIVDFLGLVLSILSNHYVFWYIIFASIIAYGVIKIHKEENKPYLKPLLKIMALYYLLRGTFDIFFM